MSKRLATTCTVAHPSLNCRRSLIACPRPGSASTRNTVGHWYEAQLLHYSLASSKNKAVVKMRLLDALQARNLNVPKNILEFEGDLKDGRKTDKEAKSGGCGDTAQSTAKGW